MFEAQKKIKSTASPVAGVPLADLPMGSLKLLNSKASGVDNNLTARDGECVKDYIPL